MVHVDGRDKFEAPIRGYRCRISDYRHLCLILAEHWLTVLAPSLCTDMCLAKHATPLVCAAVAPKNLTGMGIRWNESE